MKKIVLLAAAAVLSMTGAFAQVSDALKVKTFVLDNELTVWLNEDPNQTAAYGAVVVKAGAVDCPGTGIAHYFEHMMFKGTDKIGTIDYEAEKPYLDSISVMYDRLAETEDEAAKKDIQMEINRLSIKAADYAIPNEFDNLVSEMGGSALNAFTSYDETVYHNKFLPEHFAQWAELNSERIINPVFRLFQSELETVYEEKNMGDDELINDFRNKMLANVYKGTGYSEDIVGTTENLKNPRLGQMREFFEKYYVASNMGLILTGNLKEEDVMPIVKKTFGRIRKGEGIERNVGTLAPIVGRQDVTAQMAMPVVKLDALCFRGPSLTDPDFLAVSFLTSLLNNDAGTGLLDKLMVDKKLMVAQALPDLSFRDAGSIMVLYMPKILFQREEKATKYIMDAINTLKRGDFSDEYFESCKLSFKKQLISESENISERMQNMAFAFSDGLDWNDVLTRPERIDRMTKADLVAIAGKYFSDDYIIIHKKMGTPDGEKLQKPDYEKVVPKNRGASSAYAENLRKTAEGIQVKPRAIDFENDVETEQVAPLVKLYASKNPYNDVFSLDFSYAKGLYEDPGLERVAGYVNVLGTDDMTFDELHSRLQTMGSSISFGVDDNSFVMSVTGFDSNLDETLEIAADIMKNIKGDRKKLNSMKAEEKSAVIMNRSDMDALDDALLEKVMHGDRSEYLVDKGKFSDKELLGKFRGIQKVECDILYSGKLSAEDVASAVASHFDVNAVDIKSNAPVSLALEKTDGPAVFFVNKKKSSQSHIACLVFSDPARTQRERYEANLFSNYLGGGMSSLLFQEIREFRSMAYSTSAYFYKPSFKRTQDIGCVLYSYVGTQSDKTCDAMAIVDSLVTGTPFIESKIEITRKELLNRQCNQYPDFRSMPGVIAEDIRDGYTEDPSYINVELLESADAGTMKAIWEKFVAGRNKVWCIVGNKERVDMEGLAGYGPVSFYKASELIK